MIVYWSIFVIPVLFLFGKYKADWNLQKIMLWSFAIILVVLIGLRHEIGGDWDRYLTTAYAISKTTPFPNYLSMFSGDYGYRVLHWFSENYFYGIYTTNLICAFFFVSGLIRFCQTLPFPWLGLSIAIPFLVVVVAMGYTRQSVAVGFLMWALVDLMAGRKLFFYISIIAGSFFHLTVLMMLPIGILYQSVKINKTTLIVVAFIVISVYFIFIGKVERMIYYYLTIEFHQSSGGVLRVFINSMSAIVFFIFRKEFKRKFHDEKLWFIFSIMSILALPLSFFYSTFLDRIVIYMLPIQLVVLTRVAVLIKSEYNRTIFVVVTVCAYASLLFVWLNFGKFSSYWLPYKNILF